MLDLFKSTDAWRRPERFAELMAASCAGEPGMADARARLERALKAAAAIDAGAIARAGEGHRRDPRRDRRGAAGGDPQTFDDRA